MWLVSPWHLCRQHLLGEHVELHMLVGTIRRRKSLAGFVENGLIETASIKRRHSELVDEMERRGYNHNSPLFYHDRLNLGRVNRGESRRELKRRCKNCYRT